MLPLKRVTPGCLCHGRSPTYSITVARHWFIWALANSLGGLAGWHIAVLLGFGTLGIGLLLAWFPVGLFAGLSQCRVMSRLKPGLLDVKLGGLWVLATIAGTAVCLAIGLADWPGLLNIAEDSNTRLIVLRFVYGGAALGTIQGIMLLPMIGLRRLWVFGYWVLANALGWGLGAYYSFPAGAQAVRGLMPNWGYTGIIMGPGDYLRVLVTGSFMVGIASLISGVPFALVIRSGRQSQLPK